MSDPPRKDSSLELTAVRPRPPLSDIPGPSIEMLAEIARVQRDLEDDVDTMVPCAACEHCPTCGGLHMTSHERRQQWLAENEPVPPSRPEVAA